MQTTGLNVKNSIPKIYLYTHSMLEPIPRFAGEQKRSADDVGFHERLALRDGLLG